MLSRRPVAKLGSRSATTTVTPSLRLAAAILRSSIPAAVNARLLILAVSTNEDSHGTPASDDCALPGSGGVGSSTRGCFAENSHTPCHPEHNSSRSHPAFSPESTLRTVTRAELMPRAGLRSAASSECLHDHEISCMSTLRDAAPMWSQLLVTIAWIVVAWRTRWRWRVFRCSVSVLTVVHVVIAVLLHQWRIPKFRHLGQRLKLHVLGTRAMSPSWRTYMRCRTAVDQQKISAVDDPHQQTPQTTNTRQRREGSSGGAQHSFLASKWHSLAIGHQHRH